VPEAGTLEYRIWREKVATGRRKSTERRRKAGLRSMREIAKKYGVTVRFVSRMVDRGELAMIGCYIHEAEAARAFGGGRTAA
jgi:hypothetical protein